MTLKDRLLAKVDKDGEGGCWEWRASKVGNGYGCIGVDGKTQRAHRVSYEIFCAPIPNGMHVLHRCDNPGCVNPDHLFLGTQAENIADKIVKGRQPHGPRGPRDRSTIKTKLCEEDVRAIRASKEAQRACAKKFGISQRLVSAIRSGQRWSHTYESGANP